MSTETDKVRILYWDPEHRRRQKTFPRRNHENVYADISEYDRLNHTDYMHEIRSYAIRRVDVWTESKGWVRIR